MYWKKLRHNVGLLGRYETLTVRPHPSIEGKFEVLNGHARLEVLSELNAPSAKCDIWEVTESEARLFLAILNKLRGTDVAELRMNLLFKLLQEHPREDLAAHVPETISYLAKLERLGEAPTGEETKATPVRRDVIIMDFYLEVEQHRVVTAALEDITERFSLSDSSHALAKLATLYLEDREQRIAV
jgi:ParB-like chromosome segregation protein Spo0J